MSPHTLPRPARLRSNFPTSASANYRVDCCLKSQTCLAPLAHRDHRRRRFHCSLLIVVCPCRCHCRRLCRLCPLCRLCRRCRLCLAVPLPEVIDMIVVVVNVVVVILVVVPVAIVDNDAMPGPRRSLRRRSLPSLLSRCFLAGISAAR